MSRVNTRKKLLLDRRGVRVTREKVGKKIERESCKGERRRLCLKLGDESVPLDYCWTKTNFPSYNYSRRIYRHSIVVTYLGSLARGGAFSAPSPKNHLVRWSLTASCRVNRVLS